MTSSEPVEATLASDMARECLYRFLAAALTDPTEESWTLVLDPDNRKLAADAADFLREKAGAEPTTLGLGELPTDRLDLSALLEELWRPRDELIAEYDRVFGLVPSPECPPYETEYHSTAEPFFRSQQMADVAGFYRAFGLQPSATMPERPDHLALELEFMAFLLMKKRQATSTDVPDKLEKMQLCDDTLKKFFEDHLLWWLPAFAAGLRKKAGDGFYRELGKMLAAFLTTERLRYDLPPPRFAVQPTVIARPDEEPAGCAACV